MPFPTAPSSRHRDPGARTPADGESTPGGARRACSRDAWRVRAEIVTCTPKWSDPSHAHFDSGGPQRLDAGTPWRSAGSRERRGTVGRSSSLTSMLSNAAEKMAEMAGGVTMTSWLRTGHTAGMDCVEWELARHPTQGPDCCVDTGVRQVHDVSSDEEPLIPSSRTWSHNCQAVIQPSQPRSEIWFRLEGSCHQPWP